MNFKHIKLFLLGRLLVFLDIPPMCVYKFPHIYIYLSILASLVAHMVKRLPAVRETWVRSLGWEDLLEEKMATHSSTLAWRIPRMEEPGRL